MTAFDPSNLGLGDAGLPLVRDLVHERTGLFYDDGRLDTIAEKLAPLVIERGFRSFLDFYYLLKYDGASDSEWRRVLDALSVQETYFWREVDQVRAFACRVMPELARASAGRPIRIWSIPCATGEEPLTIAMALDEAGWFQRVPVEIYASDGSSAAIAKARAARYRERSFRVLPNSLRERYFERNGDAWSPIAALRDRVTSWSVVNLMDESAIFAFAQSHAIFCRNAFIYFSPQSVRTVVERLAAAMLPPGYLFVGASESLLSVTDRFTLEPLEGAFVYVRRQGIR